MVTTHNLGFPRIGAKRELKFALESYWNGQSSQETLKKVAFSLREKHWQQQSALNWVPVGDFSFYDQVLDMSFMLGNLPERAQNFKGSELDNFFRIARGRSSKKLVEADPTGHEIPAGEMTKWFDTNYHYIVPEFNSKTTFELNPTKLLAEIQQAKSLGVSPKPVIIGPMTYLALGKSKDKTSPLSLLSDLLVAYAAILKLLEKEGIQWVQIDEPILVTELAAEWQKAFVEAYQTLKDHSINILLTTYFGQLANNLSIVQQLPIEGLHIDAINDKEEIENIIANLPHHWIISLGVVNGRNIWKTDLTKTLDWLEPLAKKLEDRLWIAPSCSLLHVPVDLESEQKMDPEIRSWLSFATQKLEEVRLLSMAINEGRDSIKAALGHNQKDIQSRATSKRVNRPNVKAAVKAITAALGERQSPYCVRAEKQKSLFKLPFFPTTTIGSFPQTPEIRQARRQFKEGAIRFDDYQAAMKAEIAHCIDQQEALELDVFVHGEPERNDMVEYFGEQLEGFVFSSFGWVQSYGSRCVKPPILFGDIQRSHPMTVDWIRYAQSLASKPVKGMLTGPVTILNWSFVRDDQARSTTCYQLALAIREEVQDLEKAGIQIIQIDEAALREGLPLRQSQWKSYLQWAVEAFRIAANGVKDETQIHTHMCYSEFNDIIESIANMDADVITIETSRSDMELLDAFDDFNYPNEIGPGLYDIHSPNIPSEDQILYLMEQALKRIPAERLWINPDCGLKTRQWAEVLAALKNMVSAAKTLRKEL